jgi:hypothetical protein
VGSVNQGLCSDAGDMLHWGKAPGRAKILALWTPSSWKAPPYHDLLNEQPALHAKPCPIDPRRRCSAGCGIPRLLLSPIRAALHKTTRSPPNPHPSGPHDLCWAALPCLTSPCSKGTQETPRGQK